MTRNLLFLLLAACHRGDFPVEDRWTLTELVAFAPMAAWDPFTFAADVERESWQPAESWREDGSWGSSAGPDPDPLDLEPVVFDAAGAEVPVEWLLDGSDWAWVPVDGWEPGATYSVEARLRRTTSLDIVADAPLEFTVGTYGRDPTFTPEAVIGRVYALDGAPVGPGIESLALGYAGDLHLQVMAVDGDAASFRVWTSLSGQTCEVLRAVGTLSASGELVWNAASILAESDPGPLQLWDATIQAGFNSDGTQLAGLHVAGVADVRPFDGLAGVLVSDATACDVLGSIVVGACEPCPDDGDVACVEGRAWWGTMRATGDADPGDLPFCGVEIDPDAGAGSPVAFSCDMDWEVEGCGCAAGSRRGLPMGMFVGVGVVLARRRRRAAG